MEYRKSKLTVEEKVCRITDTYIHGIWVFMSDCEDLTEEAIHAEAESEHLNVTREVRCTDGTVWYNPKWMYAYAKLDDEDVIKYTDYYDLKDVDEED